MVSDRLNSRISRAMPAGALRLMGRFNVPIYRLSRGRLMNSIGNAPVLLLTTTGRRSGQQRTSPVCYLADGELVAVIGSNAGNEKAPAWAHNLRANPDAEIEIGPDRKSVRARVTAGDERKRLWTQMNQLYSGFDDYEAATSREIAVFALDLR